MHRRAVLAGMATLSATALAGFTPESHEFILALTPSSPARFELAAMKALEIDKKHFLTLTVNDVADDAAAQAALTGGAAELIMSDFVWPSLQRAGGAKIATVPFIHATGGLVADSGAGVAALADLKGKTLAVAGSASSLGYMIVAAAYAKATSGVLSADATVSFTDEPAALSALADGKAQVALLGPDGAARAISGGKAMVAGLADLAKELGAPDVPPDLGWTFDEAMANKKKVDLKAFLDAAFETRKILSTDDAAWDKLRAALNPADDAQFAALRDGWRAALALHYQPGETKPAAETFAAIAAANADALGGATALDAGTFWKGYRK